MTHIPLWVFLIPVLAVCADSILVLSVAFFLNKRIEKATEKLEEAAKSGIAEAAKNVEAAMVEHLNNKGFDSPVMKYIRGEISEQAQDMIKNILGDDFDLLPIDGKVTFHK